ncbi:MAG: hypothetical protein ACPL5I_12970, partial [Thermodesulfobacteriota bacterium]
MNKFLAYLAKLYNFFLFPRFEFQQLVKEMRAEFHARGFSWQSQVGVSLFPCFFANWVGRIA